MVFEKLTDVNSFLKPLSLLLHKLGTCMVAAAAAELVEISNTAQIEVEWVLQADDLIKNRVF